MDTTVHHGDALFKASGKATLLFWAHRTKAGIGFPTRRLRPVPRDLSRLPSPLISRIGDGPAFVKKQQLFLKQEHTRLEWAPF